MARASETHSRHNSTTDELRDSVAQVGQDIREVGAQMKNLAQEKIAGAQEFATQSYEEGVKRAQGWEAELEDYIKDRPIKSLLIAAGIGALLGLAWRRR